MVMMMMMMMKRRSKRRIRLSTAAGMQSGVAKERRDGKEAPRSHDVAAKLGEMLSKKLRLPLTKQFSI